MNKKILFMFSGQGSQYFHMGKELYENHSRFKYWMDYCNDVVSPLVEASMLDVLYYGQKKSEPFNRLLLTNPALLSIGYSLSMVLIEMNIVPDALLGYSLGEVTASVVSEVITFEEGVNLVVEMAKLVEKKAAPAEMLAIVDLERVLTGYDIHSHRCWLTCKNFPGNFVVSGLPKDIQGFQYKLTQKNIISQLLPVKYGFHTSLIDPIEKEYREIFHSLSLGSQKIPIFSSLKKRRLVDIDADYYWDVLRHTVDFEQTAKHISREGEWIYLDVGASGSLATFVKYILPADSGSVPMLVLNQFGKDLMTIKKIQSNFYALNY